jgi:hypothetical protein
MTASKAEPTEINHEVSDARAVVDKKKKEVDEAEIILEVKLDKKRCADKKYELLQAEWKSIPIARGSREKATAEAEGGATTKGNGGAGGGVVTPNEKGGAGGEEIGTGEDMELDQEKLRGQVYL